MKILFTSSECVPFIKTGGLADVVGALAPVLAKKGHDVRVVLPLYTAIDSKWQQQMEFQLHFEVQLGWRRQYCGVNMLKKDGVTYYFLDNKFYFGRPYVYGLGGDEYERYSFFCRAVLNAMPLLDFKPDIIHAHDWQSGMVPALLKIQYAHLPFYSKIRTVFTIHNLQYQGIFGIKEVQDVLGLGDGLWSSDKLECYGCANFMKAGLVYADAITTVSPSYAEEITTAYYGERLDGLIRARKDSLYGVLNGIDVNEYNPETDPMIYKTYSLKDMSGKAVDKAELQRELGLEVNPDIPLIAMVGRLTNQKGLDLVDCVIGDIMNENVQLAVLGMGDARYTNLFSWAEQQYRGRMAARFRHGSQSGPQAVRRRGLLPDALAVRALRPEPAYFPALRHRAHRARDRRSAGHGAELQRVHQGRQWFHLPELQRPRYAQRHPPRPLLLPEAARTYQAAAGTRHDRRLQLGPQCQRIRQDLQKAAVMVPFLFQKPA